MIAFEIEVNGARTCFAGVGEFGVLTTVLSWVSTHAMVAEEGEQIRKLEMHVGGLKEGNGGSDSHITWLNKDLVVGDEIRIRIVNTGEVDEPGRIEPIDPEAELKKKREYYETLKAEFDDPQFQ